MSIRPTGRLSVLVAQDGTPRGKCLMEFIAMNTRKTQPKQNANPAPVQHTDGQPRFVGVDLHKKVATFHVLSQDGTSLKSGRLTSAWTRFAASPPSTSALPTNSPSRSPATPGRSSGS